MFLHIGLVLSTLLCYLSTTPIPDTDPELELNCAGGGQVKFFEVTKSTNLTTDGYKLRGSQIITECGFTKIGMKTYNLTMTNVTVPEQWSYQNWDVSSFEYNQTFEFSIDYTLYLNNTDQLPKMILRGATNNMIVLDKNATSPVDVVNVSVNYLDMKDIYDNVDESWTSFEAIPKSIVFYDDRLPYVTQFEVMQILLPFVKVPRVASNSQRLSVKPKPKESIFNITLIIEIVFVVLIIVLLWLIRIKINCAVVTRKEDVTPKYLQQCKDKKPASVKRKKIMRIK